MPLSWLTSEIESAQAKHRRRVADLFRTGAATEVVAICGWWFGRSHGLLGVNEIDMLQDPAAWLDEVLGAMQAGAAEAADPVNFRPLAIELDALGVHFIDALLGAKAYFHEAQAWNDPLECDVALLPRPDVAASPVLQAWLRLAAHVVAATQGRLLVTAPVLSSPINIAMNLLGQRILEAMIERPAAAHHALGVIADVIIAATQAVRAAVPNDILRCAVTQSRYAPEGFGYIDGCATQMISAEHYREFLAPLDARILSQYPCGGMIHLCGAHAQHIPAWRAMPMLRSVQINDRAADDFELYYRHLRDDQIVYVGPTHTMTLDRILAISAGRRVVIQCPLPRAIPCLRPPPDRQPEGGKVGAEPIALAPRCDIVRGP